MTKKAVIVIFISWGLWGNSCTHFDIHTLFFRTINVPQPVTKSPVTEPHKTVYVEIFDYPETSSTLKYSYIHLRVFCVENNFISK